MKKFIADYEDWGLEEIGNRGLEMLTFMKRRWNVDLGGEEEKTKLLFLFN